jgi:hypothetical protein
MYRVFAAPNAGERHHVDVVGEPLLTFHGSFSVSDSGEGHQQSAAQSCVSPTVAKGLSELVDAAEHETAQNAGDRL